MNNIKLMIIGLLVPALLLIPFSMISFYTDFANKNPDPLQVAVSFNGKNYDAVEGKKAFEQYQCMDCHTIVGNGAYFAPDLTRIYKRTGGNEASLAGIIQSGSPSRGMPPMTDRGMGDEDAYRVVAFLKYANMLDTNGWPNNGSWDRDGGIDGTTAENIRPMGIWQVVAGIVFFNLMIFVLILAYERAKVGHKA
ncbi:Cytochrome C oxidase, cbb3-type, subunit III [uncultured archaeon]|nr:Cytochrome C oxidase, cbb3-type, subunit III [uncultured archaeon]